MNFNESNYSFYYFLTLKIVLVIDLRLKSQITILIINHNPLEIINNLGSLNLVENQLVR